MSSAKAETKTMQPVIQAFMAPIRSLTSLWSADAGMISEANQKQIEAGREPAWALPAIPPWKGRAARPAAPRAD